MNHPHHIILVGFSSFEKVTFESFFRLAARRPPGYVLVNDPADAHLAVVNVDDAAAFAQAMASKPAPQVLLIGNQDGGTGWMVQRRPLNLMKVLATVESLLSPQMATVPAELMPMSFAPPPAPRVSTLGSPTARAFPPAAPLSPFTSPPASPSSLVVPTAAPTPTPTASPTPAPASHPDPVDATSATPHATRPTTPAATGAPGHVGASVVSTALNAVAALRKSVRLGTGISDSLDSSRNDALSGLPAAPPPPQSQNSGLEMDHILVVDDSDIALKFMRNRLSRFGFQADLVNSGEEALNQMNTRPYKFVFLDVMMEGLDGYQTCRAIKQRKYTDGKPPIVVMLTSRGGTIDKIRGTLAGCDAYLTKPLNERDLIAVLAKHDRHVERGFQQTNLGNSKAVPLR